MRAGQQVLGHTRVGYGVNYIKQAIVIIVSFALGYAVTRKTYHFFVPQESASIAPTVNAPVQRDQIRVIDHINGVYNYQRMLALIEQSQGLKRDFYAHFAGHSSKHKPIDPKFTKDLLADLYREKMRLQRHVRHIKVQYKGHLPVKKARSLLYYQKVIEQCIRDVENMLRQM